MNIIINSSPWTQRDIEILFEQEDVIFSSADDIPTLMAEQNMYPSKNKAIQANRTGSIPLGFTVYKANKKTTMWIWNPSE
jgi:hypothetical protein